MRKKQIHPILLSFIPLVKSLGSILGEDTEIVLHDVTIPEKSIIACANTHISGRSVGAPMTDFGLKIVKTEGYHNLTGIYNYLARTNDGKSLKCGTHFIKDETGKLIGILCINRDITKLQKANSIIEELIYTPNSVHNFGKDFDEHFSGEIDDVVSGYLETARKPYLMPLHELPKSDVLNVISELDKNGFFLIKGAINCLAKELNKSKYTIYAYLREIHKADSNNNPEIIPDYL